MFKEFKDFALKGHVLDLAIGVIIGAAFGGIVESVTKDVITPIIGSIGGQPDFSAITMGPVGIDVTEARFLETFGQRNEAILPQWLGARSTPRLVAELADAKESLYRAFVAEAGLAPLPGAIDLQEVDEDGIHIKDYKVTGAWSVRNEKQAWHDQLNSYAWMVEKAKQTNVKSLQIVAIIRDWSAREAQVKEGYPPVIIRNKKKPAFIA